MLQCRYDKLNKDALRDAELYDRTGRVRTPSPEALSESEEETAPVSKGEGQCENPAGDPEFLQPHLVACVGDEVGEGCSSRKTTVSTDLDSITTVERDSDSDFHHSEQECDTESSTSSTSLEDETTVEEESLLTSTENGSGASDSPVLQQSTPIPSTSNSVEDLNWSVVHVNSFSSS